MVDRTLISLTTAAVSGRIVTKISMSTGQQWRRGEEEKIMDWNRIG
jgi:hypothetical protein